MPPAFLIFLARPLESTCGKVDLDLMRGEGPCSEIIHLISSAEVSIDRALHRIIILPRVTRKSASSNHPSIPSIMTRYLFLPTGRKSMGP
jgi:hypothetical protein